MHQFTFQLNNQNYIQAFIKYHPHLVLNSIEPDFGISLAGKQGKDLANILQQIHKKNPKIQKDSKITVKTKATPTQAILQMFPQFEAVDLPKTLLKTVEQELALDRDYHSPFTTRYQEIAGYISFNEQQGIHAAMIPPALSLTQEEAWKVLNLVHQKTPIFSAINLPSIETIWIQTPSGNQYRLKYGKKATISLCEWSQIQFDLDDGFKIWEGKPAKELTDKFRIWKEKGYQGELTLQSGALKKFKDNMPKRILPLPPSNRFTEAPTRYPVKLSFLMGIAASALLMAVSSSGMIILATCFAVSMISLGVIKLREFIYRKESERRKGPVNVIVCAEESAYHEGYRAAKNQKVYVNSFKKYKNWRHYCAFGAGMMDALDDVEKKVKAKHKIR